ncbi:unnamed protein product, partial [marine sediment metagenome]
WANFSWTGDTSAQDVADCYNDENIAVMYRLDAETQVFERWIRDREALSTMGDVAQFDALLALNASDEPATCQMPGAAEAPATPTPSPTPTPTSTPSPTPTPTPAVAGGPPTDYLDTFHATLDMSMGNPLAEMNAISEGDFEAPDRCSCDVTLTTGTGSLEFQVEDHIIVIGDDAWVYEGDDWSETTPSEKSGLLEMCPACPSFWEGYSLEPPQLPGEHETKNGVSAIHYSLAELCEALLGVGWMPEEL